MNGTFWSIRGGGVALVALLLSLAGGCTSAISTAYLRDTLWDLAEHASETDPEPPDADSETFADITDSADPTLTSRADDAIDEERREVAIDEAVARVKRLGPIDEATRTTLIETLQQTQQEDWPVVVEAFASTLEAANSSKAAAEEVVARAVPPIVAASHVVAKADLDGAAVDQPAAPPAAVEVVAPEATDVETSRHDAAGSPPPVTVPRSDPESGPESDPGVAATSPPPSLAVRNACFASRVQGWGVVDRFAKSRFQPGQEVIVYFELDQLSAREHVDGHTTRIDTSLRLVGADGRRIHEWTFEPLEETSEGRRHDYFARYLVTLPETLPEGQCQLEVAVSDAIAGRTSHASLPLEVAGR